MIGGGEIRHTKGSSIDVLDRWGSLKLDKENRRTHFIDFAHVRRGAVRWTR